MSFDIEGLVQTSLNLGILVTQEQEVTASFAVRSSVTSEKDELVERLVSLVETLGGTVTCAGDYPAWEYQQESPLRDLMIEVFEKQYGRKPVVQALHAGVECGLFAGKLPGLDCVSFGPDMTNIHTFNESLDVASAARTWEYLVEILKRLK
jgi:dipeptidase D